MIRLAALARDINRILGFNKFECCYEEDDNVIIATRTRLMMDGIHDYQHITTVPYPESRYGFKGHVYSIHSGSILAIDLIPNTSDPHIEGITSSWNSVVSHLAECARSSTSSSILLLSERQLESVSSLSNVILTINDRHMTVRRDATIDAESLRLVKEKSRITRLKINPEEDMRNV